MKELLLQFVTPTNITIAVSALLGLAATLLGFAKYSDSRRRNIALATFHGYHIAKDIADATKGEDAWDLVAAALESADKYMVANGWRPLKEGEKVLVGMTVQSLKSQDKTIELGAQMASPSLPSSDLK